MGTVAVNIPLEAGQIPQNALNAAATQQNITNAQQENALRRQMAPMQLAQAQQGIQGGQLDIQQKQIQMQQQKAINDAYRESFTVDPDTGRPTFNQEAMIKALALSGHGAAIPSILEAQTKWQQANASLAETKGKLTQQMLDFQGSTGMALQTTDYDPHQAIALLTQSVRQGSLDAPVAAGMIQQIQGALQQDPSGAAAKAIIKPIADRWVGQSVQASKVQNESKTAQGGLMRGQAATSAEARKATDDLVQRTISGLSANAPKTADDYAATVYGLSDPEARKRLLSTVPISQYDPAKSPALLQRAGMTPYEQMNADKAPKPGENEWIATVNDPNAAPAEKAAAQANLDKLIQVHKAQQRPISITNAVTPGPGGAPSAAAQMAADGRMAPGTLRAMLRRDPNFMNQVVQADPNFSEDKIQERYDTLKEFTSSSNTKAGGQVLALNTLIHHADLYLATADALKNGQFRPGNAAYNAVANAFGSAPPTQANLVARFLAGETGKVATGGVPAEGEINGILQNMGNDAGPDQIKGAAQSLLGIAAGRMVPLQEKVNHAGLQARVQVLGPDAQAILTRHGFDPATMKPIAKGGGGGAIPAAVSTLLSAPSVKPGIHKLSDGSSWMKGADGTITRQ